MTTDEYWQETLLTTLLMHVLVWMERKIFQQRRIVQSLDS